MPNTITLRTEKEAPLTYAEMDANFKALRNLVEVPTVAALQALGSGSVPGGYGAAITQGCLAANDGGGGMWFWDAASTATQDVGSVVQANGVATGRWRRFIHDGYVNAKAFGVVGDFNPANGAGTDDTAALQSAIDFAIQNRISVVKIPAGAICKTTDTLHLGYGVPNRGFTTIVLEAEHLTIASSAYGSGSIYYAGPGDRPAINIQGGRDSGVRNLILRRYTATPADINSMSVGTGTATHLADDVTQWTEAGVSVTHLSNAFCGICIDGYSDAHPSGTPANQYPTVSYPAWLGGGIAQYGKLASSHTHITNCQIQGFYIGISLAPNNSGNGDYTRLRDTSVGYCAYGFSWNNQNSRLIDFSNTIFGFNYCGWINRLGGTGAVGGATFNLENSALNEFGYKAFDIAIPGGTLNINNGYAEHLREVGTIRTYSTGGAHVTMSGCSFFFTRGPANNGAMLVPTTFMVIDGLVDNCSFGNLYGVEYVYSTKNITFRNCKFANYFAKNAFPNGGTANTFRGVQGTKGVAILKQLSDRSPFIEGYFGATYNYADESFVVDADFYRGTGVDNCYSVYSNGSAWFDNNYGTEGQHLRYKLPAARCLTGSVTALSLSSGITLAGTWAKRFNTTPRIGDVIVLSGATPHLILSYNTGDNTFTALRLTGWKKLPDDDGGTYAVTTGSPAFTTGIGNIWSLYRTGNILPGSAYSYSCTAGSPNITIKDANGADIADASTLVAIGDTLVVCPNQYSAAVNKPPFVGAVEVTGVSGGTVTVNQNALRTMVFPATPALYDYALC